MKVFNKSSFLCYVSTLLFLLSSVSWAKAIESVGEARMLVGEPCDDLNHDNGDGCSAAGLVEAGWICNDSPSYCNPFTGDGILVGYEQCDDGNGNGGDGCSPDGMVEPGYACSGAPSNCTQPLCGNGVLDAGEDCDDFNTFSTDGCSSNCTIEQGYTCRNDIMPSVCNLTSLLFSPPFTAYEIRPYYAPGLVCATNHSQCGIGDPFTGSQSECCTPSVWPTMVLALQWLPGQCAPIVGKSCNPVVLPAHRNNGGNFFTIHGLWPGACDGTFTPPVCRNATARRTNCTTTDTSCPLLDQYLQQFPALHQSMRYLWPTYSSKAANEAFWGYEYDKHGICFAPTFPECSFQPSTGGSCNDTIFDQQCNDKYNYFSTVLQLRKKYDFYEIFAKAGILPSYTPYNYTQLSNAVTAVTGPGNVPHFVCNTNRSGARFLTEIRISFRVNQRFHFVPTPPPAIGAPSQAAACPQTGIYYLPNDGSLPPSTAAAATTTPASGGQNATTSARSPVTSTGFQVTTAKPNATTTGQSTTVNASAEVKLNFVLMFALMVVGVFLL